MEPQPTGDRDRLAGRVALVTGGSSGIGAGTVERLAADGARVVIADLQEGLARPLVKTFGDRVVFVHADVSLETDVDRAVQRAIEEFGQLDIMFNNAGVIGATGSIVNLRASDVDATFAVNLRGVLLGMKHAARVMIPRRTGVILSTSSVAALTGGLGSHAYSATKAGIIGLTRSVAAELRPYGIRVNAICPGTVATPMTIGMGEGPNDPEAAERALDDRALLGRVGQPHDIAAAVSFLASDDAALITGQTIVIDAGLTSIGGDAPYSTGLFSDAGAIFEAGRRQ